MLKDLLSGKKIILASGSPRRKELLKGLDIEFIVDTKTNFIEEYPNDLPLETIPQFLAVGKSNGFHRQLLKDEILITADTMVLCKGEIMGKPKDEEDAKRMLNKLQNCTHSVITGVCIRSNEKFKAFTVSTEVCFNAIDNQEIEYYINKYKPFDKAGAYAVQEWIGFIGIKAINGSYYNVVGLPVQRLYEELKLFIA